MDKEREDAEKLMLKEVSVERCMEPSVVENYFLCTPYVHLY